PPEGVDRGELRELVRRGLVLASDGTWFTPEAIDTAAHILAGLLAEQPDGLTVAQIRDALGTSRKFLLPLLALLDGQGITRRRGDLRVAGPRLPEVSGP
ncbi:MAG TPA: SelB C-terminal domain-containing protein, partial [Acidimicrobiales bacterium]|nr:SelB C-terminal domain-containing protein [Acidimicrobiales bacterium]